MDDWIPLCSLCKQPFAPYYPRQRLIDAFVGHLFDDLNPNDRDTTNISPGGHSGCFKTFLSHLWSRLKTSGSHCNAVLPLVVLPLNYDNPRNGNPRVNMIIEDINQIFDTPSQVYNIMNQNVTETQLAIQLAAWREAIFSSVMYCDSAFNSRPPTSTIAFRTPTPTSEIHLSVATILYSRLSSMNPSVNLQITPRSSIPDDYHPYYIYNIQLNGQIFPIIININRCALWRFHLNVQNIADRQLTRPQAKKYVDQMMKIVLFVTPWFPTAMPSKRSLHNVTLRNATNSTRLFLRRCNGVKVCFSNKNASG